MGCKCDGAIQLRFKRLHPDAQVPCYQTAGAAGFDLSAVEDMNIFPGETMVVKTGLACEIPSGYEMQIRPRSGIALKTPLLTKNAPGTIDCDYRGEIGIILHCLQVDEQGNKPYKVKKGDRLAQGVICKLPEVSIVEVIELSNTERGAGSYGSTGVSNG